MDTAAATALLEKNGFLTTLCAEREDDFVRACKEGLDDVVEAFLDIGMPVNARAGITHETALIKAAEGGHLSTIELLVRRGAGLELRDSSDDTAFRTALNWGHPEAARLLKKLGADVEVVSKWGETALEHAIAEKPENVDLLLELGADGGACHQGRSPMAAAMGKHDTALVKQLLKAGATPSSTCDALGSALHKAARDGGEFVDVFLEHDADLAVTDAHGLTPLDHALLSNNETAAKKLGRPTAAQQARADFWAALDRTDFDKAFALVDSGAVDVNARNASHNTGVRFAAHKGHADAVRGFVDRGADLKDAVNDACSGGHAEVVEFLLDKGGSVVDADGRAGGFGSAVWNGRADIVRAVLSRVSSADKAKLAEHVRSAVMQKNPEVMEALVKGGVPLDHNDDIGGETPLIGAVGSWHHAEVVRLLLDGGAGLEVKDHSNVSPLLRICGHYGWNDSYEETLRLLIERGARFDVKDAFGSTVWNACKDGAKKIVVELMVDEPLRARTPIAELAKKHSWATLAMFIGAHSGLIPQLIDAGVDPNPPDGMKVHGVLHAAVTAQDEDLVDALLSKDRAFALRIDHCEQYGGPALCNAAGKPSLRITNALLDAGADIDFCTESGATAVAYAVDQPAQLALLHQRGARFDQPSNGPLIHAAGAGNVAACTFFVDHGARVDVQSSYGETPLHAAVEKGHGEIVRLLVERGASPNFRARTSGQTPLTLAAQKGDAKLVRLFVVEHGGDLDVDNAAGESARALIGRRKGLKSALKDLLGDASGRAVPVERLDASLVTIEKPWHAVYGADHDGVVAALDAGFDVNSADAWGVTPLMAAVLFRNTRLVSELLERGADPERVDGAGAMAWDYTGFGRDGAVDALLSAKMKQTTSMDRLNAQAARSLLLDAVKTALTRGDIPKIASLVKEKKLHVFLGVDGRGLMELARHDEDLVEALSKMGIPDPWAAGKKTVKIRNQPAKKTTKRAKTKTKAKAKTSTAPKRTAKKAPAKKTNKKTVKKPTATKKTATKKTAKKTATKKTATKKTAKKKKKR